MLTLSGISKSFGGRTLFEDVTLQVSREDRLGLVGPNGAGKSTLFKLILQQEEPDGGDVTFERGVTVGFLPQESAPAGEETVLELATGTVHGGEQVEADGHTVAKAKRILSGLSFRETDFERPARELSGGWVMRAHLARLLVQEPDLLMLDEPTNHLDLETLIWFQEYLQDYPGAILVISHDREFLNQLITGTIEIRSSSLYRYTGNYDSFLLQRAASAAQQLAAYKNQQREIARLQEFADRFRAKASKASQAQSKLKQIERMEKIEAPESAAATVGFSFPQPIRSGQHVVRLRGVHHAYGTHVVYRGIDFEIERGQRISFVGPNGAGKSTLLKILAAALPLQQGERVLGHNVKCGYYSQYRTEMLQASRTVLSEALDTPQRVTEQSVRTLLGSFLFRDDDVFKTVSVLSGGEKSRLALVKLLLDPPNFLLMDEPTTHLDMPSIDALIGALREFTGTVAFISHDVHFIRALSSHTLHVNAGRLTPYPGGYDYYLEKTRATSARAALTAGGTSPAPSSARPQTAVDIAASSASRKEQRRAEAGQREARTKDLRNAEKAVADCEKRVAELEAKQNELSVELENPATYEKAGLAMHYNRQILVIVDDLAHAQAEWERAGLRLQKLKDAAAEG